MTTTENLITMHDFIVLIGFERPESQYRRWQKSRPEWIFPGFFEATPLLPLAEKMLGYLLGTGKLHSYRAKYAIIKLKQLLGLEPEDASAFPKLIQSGSGIVLPPVTPAAPLHSVVVEEEPPAPEETPAPEPQIPANPTVSASMPTLSIEQAALLFQAALQAHPAPARMISMEQATLLFHSAAQAMIPALTQAIAQAIREVFLAPVLVVASNGSTAPNPAPSMPVPPIKPTDPATVTPARPYPMPPPRPPGPPPMPPFRTQLSMPIKAAKQVVMKPAVVKVPLPLGWNWMRGVIEGVGVAKITPKEISELAFHLGIYQDSHLAKQVPSVTKAGTKSWVYSDVAIQQIKQEAIRRGLRTP